jgi:hypothetical protein
MHVPNGRLDWKLRGPEAVARHREQYLAPLVISDGSRWLLPGAGTAAAACTR